MNNSVRTPTDPWRRHKLVAIPILAVILAIMMVRNFAGTGTPPPIVPPPRPTRILTSSATVIAPDPAATRSAAQWPKLALEDIIAKNPFGSWDTADTNRTAAENPANASHLAKPGSADSDETATSTEQAERLASEKVQAVYHDDAGTAAIVDSHVIHPGDTLDGRIQIVTVTDDGIMVKKP